MVSYKIFASYGGYKNSAPTGLNLAVGRCCIAPQPAQNQNSSPSTILSLPAIASAKAGVFSIVLQTTSTIPFYRRRGVLPR